MTLDRLVRSLASLAGRFFRWWLAELAACVPARLRLDNPWARDELVLLMGPREAILGRDRADGRFEAEERLALGAHTRATLERDTPVRLRLGAETALRLTIKLPAAALENLAEAVSFQLDRYTPFPPEQVYLACTPGERAGDTVPVATTVVERQAVVDAVLEAQRMGFHVAAVEVARGDLRERAADALPVSELSARPWGQVALVAASLALFLALAAAAIVLPFSREEARADAVARQLTAARAKAEVAQRLETAIAAQQNEANFLADRKRTQPSALEILAELTRIAPDDTYLASMQYTGDGVQIAGLSHSASGLLGLFGKSSVFANAEFRSPVTPDPQTGAEHFVIAAQVPHGGSP